MAALSDVAKLAGVSTATVSRALRNDPAVSADTRKKVKSAAHRLRYRINPYAGTLFSLIRRKRCQDFKGNLGLVWFDHLISNEEGRAPIRQSVFRRAQECGYIIDEFDRADYRPATLTKVLRSRGIRGILVSPPYQSSGKVDLDIPLDGSTCVTMGWAVRQPILNTVRFDHYQAMQLAIHHAEKRFKTRFAAFCDYKKDQRADHVLRASFLAHHPGGAVLASSLFFDSNFPELIYPLLARRAIDGLIVDSPLKLPRKLTTMLPANKIVALSNPRDLPCIGWVDSQWNLLGSCAVDMLLDLLQRRAYGIPKMPLVMLIPPLWSEGKNSGLAIVKK
jgi:LacI family transcriptional regulator